MLMALVVMRMVMEAAFGSNCQWLVVMVELIPGRGGGVDFACGWWWIWWSCFKVVLVVVV